MAPVTSEAVVDAKTYDGKPCIHGHGTRRYISTNGCVECSRLREQDRYLKRYTPKTGERRGRLRHLMTPEVAAALGRKPRKGETQPRTNRGRPKPWIKVKRPVDPLVAELREIRLEQGWTQEDLANRVGITEHTLRSGENGINQTTLANLRAWSQALGYNLKLEKIDV